MGHGLGLRAQIVLALSAAFVVAFTALGLVVMRVSQRATEVERQRRAQSTVRALAVGLGTPRAGQRERLENLIGSAGIRGLALQAPGRRPMAMGDSDGKPDAFATFANGYRLYLWSEQQSQESNQLLGDLLRLYLFITGGGILLLAYVALTYLIVRPVENATRAAERMTEGHLEIDVPVRGAAEVSRLAVSFNRMARELRVDRAALAARVQDLERATHELEAAQQQLIRSEKLASVGRLSAGIAHEIGNPLAAILGFVELLRTTDLEPEEQQEFLRRIQAETERIHHIIRDLLDFSRRAPEEDELHGHCDVREVVENAVKLVAPQKDLQGIDLQRRLPEDLPEVNGSADHLTQVLLNLLLNAADAVHGEGDILIDVTSDEDHVTLAVVDSGPGIDESVLETLFDPFVTTKPTGKGTGLGLAVCHALMERMGGEIRASNEPGSGARFELRIPYSKGDSAT